MNRRTSSVAIAAAFLIALAGMRLAVADEAAGAGKIVNPASNAVAFSYLLDGQAQTLQAGFSQDIQAGVVIKFDRGNGAGTAEYTLAASTYTFTPSEGHWELNEGDAQTVANAASSDRTVTETSTSSSGAAGPADPITDDERAMFGEMWGAAPPDADRLTRMANQWAQGSHAARKRMYVLTMARRLNGLKPRGSNAKQSEMEGTDNDKLVALSTLARFTPDGKQLIWRASFLWSEKDPSHLPAFALAHNRATAAAINGRKIVGLDFKNGKVLWITALPVQDRPIAIRYSDDDEEIIVKQTSGVDLKFQTIDGVTSETEAVNYVPRSVVKDPTVAGTDNDQFVAFASISRIRSDGKQLWKLSVPWTPNAPFDMKSFACAHSKSSIAMIVGRFVACIKYDTGVSLWWTRLPIENHPATIRYSDDDSAVVAEQTDGQRFEFSASDGTTTAPGAICLTAASPGASN